MLGQVEFAAPFDHEQIFRFRAAVALLERGIRADGQQSLLLDAVGLLVAASAAVRSVNGLQEGRIGRLVRVDECPQLGDGLILSGRGAWASAGPAMVAAMMVPVELTRRERRLIVVEVMR